MRGNVAELLTERATERPDAVALVEARDGGRSLTWADLDAAADDVARALSARGVVAGRRVGIALPPSVPFVAAYLGAHRAGVVAVPLDPHAPPTGLRQTLEHAGIRLVLAGGSTLDDLRTAAAGLSLVVDGEPRDGETSWDDFLAAPGTGAPPAPRDPEGLATLLYTGGRGNGSRGVMLSHRALLANIAQVATLEPPVVRGDDVVLGLLPMFHVSGVGLVLGQVLASGARLVLLERADADTELRAMADHGVTVVPLAPPLVASWLGRPGLREAFGQVRTVLSGALPLDPELAVDLLAETGVVVEQGYGLAEAAPVVTATAASPGRDRSAPAATSSVGHPLPGVEVRVVDEGDRDAARGDLGEIHVRGPNLFDGYWPDATGGPGPDGWWATGDVGLLADDGSLVLVDRTRERVVVDGFTVFPREVEEVVVPLPEVAEVAVIGAEGVPGGGEGLVAFVVPADGIAPDDVRDAVVERCRTMLPRYRWPNEVHVVDGLPHAATGEIAKSRLRARLRAGELGLA